jgi:hypothetical protein
MIAVGAQPPSIDIHTHYLAQSLHDTIRRAAACAPE